MIGMTCSVGRNSSRDRGEVTVVVEIAKGARSPDNDIAFEVKSTKEKECEDTQEMKCGGWRSPAGAITVSEVAVRDVVL